MREVALSDENGVECGCAHPVSVVDVENSIDSTDTRAVDVAADYAVRALPPRLGRQRMLIAVHHLGRKL